MTGHVQNPSLAAEEQEVMDGPAIKQDHLLSHTGLVCG